MEKGAESAVDNQGDYSFQAFPPLIRGVTPEHVISNSSQLGPELPEDVTFFNIKTYTIRTSNSPGTNRLIFFNLEYFF